MLLKFKNLSFALGNCNYVNILGSNIDCLKLLAEESSGHYRPISVDLVVLDLPYNLTNRANDAMLDWASIKDTLTYLSKAVDLSSCTLVFWHNYFHTGELLSILNDLQFSCIQPVTWVKPDCFAAAECMFSAHETGMFVWPNPQYKLKAAIGKHQGKCIVFLYFTFLDKQSFFITQAPKGHIKDNAGNVQNLGQKSIDLYRYILEHYTSPFGLVLELFAGTATMNRAAMSSKRSCISIEMLSQEFETSSSLLCKHRDNLLVQFKNQPILLPCIQRPLCVFDHQEEVVEFLEDLRISEERAEAIAKASSKAKDKEEAQKAKEAKQQEKAKSKPKKSGKFTFFRHLQY